MCLVLFLVAATISASMSPPCWRVALRLGGVNLMDPGRIRPGAVTRMSGLAVVFGFTVPTVALLLGPAPLLPMIAVTRHQFIALVIGAAVVATLGALDEKRSRAALIRLPVLLATAAGMWLSGFRIGASSGLPAWLDFSISVMWITGTICLLCSIDRRRGLAAGVVFSAALANIALSLALGNQPGALFASMIAGAALIPTAFGWSIPVAGRTIPMFLGHVLATASLATRQAASTAGLVLAAALALLLLARFVGNLKRPPPVDEPPIGHTPLCRRDTS